MTDGGRKSHGSSVARAQHGRRTPYRGLGPPDGPCEWTECLPTGALQLGSQVTTRSGWVGNRHRGHVHSQGPAKRRRRERINQDARNELSSGTTG